MAALSEDERHRLALLEARRRQANDRARRRSLAGSPAALRALHDTWEALRLYQRERGQDG